MPHLLIRHQVTDYAAWRKAYDEHAPAREAAGLHELHVWRNIENSSDVVLLFEASDMNEAKKLLMSADLSKVMTAAGVRGLPEVRFLEDAGPA